MDALSNQLWGLSTDFPNKNKCFLGFGHKSGNHTNSASVFSRAMKGSHICGLCQARVDWKLGWVCGHVHV